ncbi:MAG: AI-2E family transporter [Elusimicrobiota bacterium]|jgi:AI-2 transport protein TqsA|nr:AI-2E family transporter [Elusimicrobiota bacterium]
MINKIKLSQYVPVISTCLVLLAGVALTAFLAYTKTVMMPFVIALFISMVSNTIANWMRIKWRIPRVLGLVIMVLIFLAFATITVLFITSSIETFMQSADIYLQKLQDTVEWAVATAQHFGIKANEELLLSYLNNLPLFSMAKTMGGGIFSVFTTASLVCLFVLFMFMGRATEKTTLESTIEKQISFYLIIKIAVALLTSFLTWIVLAIVGSELLLMFTLLTFVLNFIPNIGPVISTVLPMPVLFLQYGFDWHLLLALCLLSAVHFAVGNVLETKWMGKGMDLSPVVVIACLIFWALVWGVMGALLAVPLTSIIKMVLERSAPTKPLADILSGRLPFK